MSEIEITEEITRETLPVIAIVGRPNVGKSTLFNVITHSRQALVADQPGVTRDRHYAEAFFQEKRFFVVDTGGIGQEETEIDQLMSEQSWLAVEEADHIIFLLDAKAGLTPNDEMIAKRLRQTKQKKIFVVLNKTDGLDLDVVKADFYRLGFGEPITISAAHQRGIVLMLETLTKDFPVIPKEIQDESRIRIAVVGRPNVGKSTLINRMLGEDRVIVCDMPGTTRDSIFIPYDRHGKQYTLIDTAGVRRRSKVYEAVEKFSIIKTLQAIDAAHVVIFVFNAQESVHDQDLKLLGQVLDTGKAIVIAVNKWDNLETDQRDWVKRELERRLSFIDFARIHFISALHGTGVGDLYQFVEEAYRSACYQGQTSEVNQLLEKAIRTHQPPLVGGRRIKLRYAHWGGQNPPRIIIHGNQLDKLPGSYLRYLEKYFRERLRLIGTPIKIELKTNANPYVDEE